MATLGIDGLASGLDTTSIISQLMQIEAAPQTLLKSKKTTTQNIVTALQAINTKVKSLAQAATSAASADSWRVYKATSSASAATATTTADAAAGSVTFSVDAVAKRQVSLSAAVADGSALVADNPPVLTVRKADGTTASVTAASNSLADLAAAINGTDLGATATVVRVAGGDTPQYRLQVTSEATGLDGAVELFAGDADAVAGGTAVRLDTNVAVEAADASITLWKGSAYEQSFTQSSNTFSGLMTGVDVTVSAVTQDDAPVTVTVAPDSAPAAKLASGLVGALSVVLSDIDSRTATTTVTNADGTTSISGGLLSGDSAVRSLRSALVDAASYPVDGVSPSTVGIVLGRDGTVTFDDAKFAEALAADPEGTSALVQKLADRVESAATTAADPYDGTLTQKITSQQSQVTSFADQIADWDRRLEIRRSTLQATYSALEVTLSNLQSQSSWLASQLSSLSPSAS